MNLQCKLVAAGALIAASQFLATAAPPPTTDLSLWLAADVGLTLNGQTIARWDDQSGQGHNAYQTSAASQPQLVTTALGNSGVRFDGVNDFLSFTNDINNLGGLTIFLVANNSSAAQTGGTGYSDSPAIFWNETASWGWVFLSPFQTNVNWRIGSTIANNNERYARPTSIRSGYSLTELLKNSDVEMLYVDNALARTTSGKAFTTFGVREDGYLGRGANTYFSGEILEVLVYNAALSDTDRQAVEAYLHDKYFSNQQPTVAITSPVNFATFTAPANIPIAVDANDDTSVTNVEFFVNGTSIGNDTTAPYTIAWNNVSGGAYGLTVKATDGQGASAVSSRVVVLVNYATPQEGPPLSGLGLWLKADAGITSSANKISAWADQSGFERLAVQPVAAAQPTLVTGGNGKPAINFDGVTNFMNFSMPVSGLNGLTMVAVVNNTAPQNAGGGNEGQGILHWTESAGWGGLSLGVFQNYATWRIGTTQVQSGSPNFPGPAYTRPESIQRNYSRTVVVKEGETENLYVDGALATSVSGKFETTAGINENGGNIGRGVQSGFTYFRGELQEILVYTNALSATDLDNLDTYLRTKYWSKAQPTVTITSPVENTDLTSPASLPVTVDVADSDGTIAKVEFFDSGMLVGTATAAPWSFTLSVTAGVHNLTAKATDNEGLFNYSAPVFVFGRAASGFALLDNFETRSLASILFQGDWLGAFSEDRVRLDPTTFTGGNPTNKVLRLAKGNQSLSFPALIPDGDTGTLFLRAASTTWDRDDVSFGFSDRPSFGYASVNDFEVQGRRYTGGGLANPYLAVRDGSTLYTNSQAFRSDVWYKIWMVVDNASDTWKMYVQGGEFAAPTPVDYGGDTTFDFYHGASANPLIKFFIWAPLQSVSNGQNGGFWMDDIYLASGENLGDPTLPAGPTLTVIRSGDSVLVSWPASTTGVVLQTSSSLAPPAWSDVSEAPVVVNDQATVTLPLTGVARFFSLRQE